MSANKHYSHLTLEQPLSQLLELLRELLLACGLQARISSSASSWLLVCSLLRFEGCNLYALRLEKHPKVRRLLTSEVRLVFCCLLEGLRGVWGLEWLQGCARWIE